MQNWLVSQVTKRLSKDLNTEVDVNSVSFALFNRMRLNGTLVKDRNQDTLLYAGSLNVNITDWFFFKDYIELKYLGLTDAKIHLHRTDSVWNYQFLIDFFSVPGSDKKKDDRPIQLNIKNIQLENIAIFQQDEWIGEDRKISLASMDMDARQIDFPNKKVEINSITINQPVFSIFHYPGLRVRRNRAPRPPSAPVDGLQWNPDLWLVHVSELNITNGNFTHDKKTERAPFPYFDGNHIDFNNINARLRDLRWELDTIRTNLHLATKERSGFEVKSLKSDFSFFPGGMAFEQLDITTNRSHLTNYFSMQYEDFNRDMGDFIHSVILTGNFEDAKIDSDDIAYFAPELSNWKKQITINGQARGTIDNLKARNMLIEAGSNTVLNGDISLTGLPDIRSTYIDFKARDFRTTYKDAVTFVPQLKNITQPRLDAVKYLHFRGSFTGFITDFVTYGTITTNLGTIVSDLNMKLPENKVSTYSGGLSSQGFDLGSFTGSSEIGNITFSSKLKGAGFDAKTVNADLDAVIDKVEFRGYEYSNIRAVGKLSKKLFNGTFEINDPNAEGHLEGIVDLNGETSRFNFDAEVAVARLKNLNITRDEFVFSGKFQLNLEGNDIDNFLGEARVYDASLLRDQKRLSFDSLSLSSRIIQDHKTLILSSNEFDVVVVGKFAVREMPTAVQLFLSKYYPSYINKPLRQVENEDFSFVVKTKNVDEYIQLIDKSLSGFNSSSVSGRVNSKENIFSLDADIPHFTLNNIAFTGLILKANGDLNNLSVETSITNTFINDSLSFPETNITVNSRSDTSDISVNATSTQAFNAADIQARVITLKEGLKIRFNSSTFDLNGKNWTIDSGGELILGRNQLTFSQIKVHQDQQLIRLYTEPSTVDNTNVLRIELSKLNIGDFSPFLVKQNRLEGLLNGSIKISDPLGKFNMEGDIKAEQFRLDNDSIGIVLANGTYSKTDGLIKFKTSSPNDNYQFDIDGLINTLKNSDSPQINITANLNKTSIKPLEKYLQGVFSKVEGFATGRLVISGTGNNITYTGPIRLENAVLKIDYTQVEYAIPNAIVNMRENDIQFGSFVIYDRYGDSARVTGSMGHRNFRNMNFNFSLNTSRLELLNTTSADNSEFYGMARGRANVTLNGPERDMRMVVRAEATDSSHIIIPSSESREGGIADFIVWKVYGREMTEEDAVSRETNFTIDLDLTANNLVQIELIMDELTGDAIKARGRGNLDFHVGTKERLTINGRYEIDEGQYNFSFQTLIKKPFQLREGAGNYIQWNGDPYQADIRIDAEYIAENVRFSDLLSSQISGLIEDPNVRRYRGEVYVIAQLREQLSSPNISFKIDFPSGSPVKREPYVANIISQIENNQQELNKQVTYLVVFNSFAPFSSNTGDIGSTFLEGVVVNTLSGIFSNTLSREFNNVLQKVFNDKSLKVNISTSFYSGTNIILENNAANSSGLSIDRSNFNFSVGKSILDDRLTFNFGSELDFGLSAFQQAQLNFQFLPDLNAEWKITPDGRVRATFFTRNSYDFYMGRQRNRSGAGISFHKEFDKIKDLFRKRNRQQL